jgi:hypothetical protein
MDTLPESVGEVGAGDALGDEVSVNGGRERSRPVIGESAAASNASLSRKTPGLR